MSIRINYNPMSVQTHRNLTLNDRLMTKVLERLSSGQRISSSADDPAGMVVSNSVRFHRRGVDRATANAEEAVTMLQTAEGGMEQVTGVLQRIRNLALSALSPATTDANQMRALQNDLDAAVGSLTTIAEQTSFGGISLLNGSLRDTALSDDAKEYYRSLGVDYTKLPGGIQDGSTFTIQQPGWATLSRTQAVSSYAPGTADTALVGGSGTIAITGHAGTVNLTVNASTSIGALVSAVNAATGITGVMAGYDQTTGALTFESTNYGATAVTVVAGGGVTMPAPAVTAGVNRTVTFDYVDGGGVPQQVTLTQDPTSTGGRVFRNLLGGPPEGAAAPHLGFSPGAFSLEVKDISDGGIGATIPAATADLTGTRTSTTAFQIGALASQRVTVEIPDMRAGALGHGAGLAGSGYASLADLVTGQAFINGDASEALQVIDAALEEVNEARGEAGALQGNTIERVLDSLRVGSQNLSEFESILRDVDMAAESAEYARVQVMVQAATAMLAQANQTPQTILQLLR